MCGSLHDANCTLWVCTKHCTLTGMFRNCPPEGYTCTFETVYWPLYTADHSVQWPLYTDHCILIVTYWPCSISILTTNWSILATRSILATVYLSFYTGHIVACTLATVHWPLYTDQCILTTVYWPLYIYWPVYTDHCILTTVYCPLYTAWPLYTVHCILKKIQEERPIELVPILFNN
jgi:hypothetical protein